MEVEIIHYHQYQSESDGTSCDSRENVFPDIEN
jgi:hypothetical protein